MSPKNSRLTIRILLFGIPFLFLLCFKISSFTPYFEYLRLIFLALLIVIISNYSGLGFLKKKVNATSLFFLILILNGIIANFLYLELDNVSTLSRYILFFFGCTLLSPSLGNSIIKNIHIYSLPVIAIGILQIIFNDTYLVNGVERISGPYYLHSSGYSLMLVCILPILIFKWYQEKSKSFLVLGIILISIYLLLRTGSRAGFIGFILSIIYVYKGQILKKKYLIPIIISIPVLSYKLVNLIMTSTSTKRIALLIQNGIFDASSNERLMIINRSIMNLDPLYLFTGIGTGYFDNFQETLTGERIAAHNNVLLHLIEGGVITLLLYLAHLVYSYKLITRVKEIRLKQLLLLVFINVEIFGIINNNYYYFVPYFLNIILIQTLPKNERI